MTAFSILYLLCFFVGLVFAIASAVLSGAFGGHVGGHLDLGGHDLGAGGHGPDIGVGSVPDGAVHFSPLSPTTIAMFVTTFGGVGYILENVLHGSLGVHILGATASGFVVAATAFYFFAKVFRAVQSTSQSSAADLIGAEAQVIAAIPAGGTGEIAYTLRGVRLNSPARTEGGAAIPSGRIVIVRRAAAGVCYVETKLGS